MEQDQIQALINQSRQNDVNAFALLVTEYQSLVFRLAFRLLCDEDDAKDIVQETFVKVWLSLDKYNNKYRFSTWIYKIAANVCYDHLRSLQYLQRNRQTDFGISVQEVIAQEDVETSFTNQELKSLIIQLTRNLTPKQKLVFTLRDLEEREIEEIEVITGLSAAKIKSNLYLARKYIRNKINEMEN